MYEIKILSDEEFVENKKRKRRMSFLKELEQMSKPARPTKSSSFSIKDVSVKEEPKETESLEKDGLTIPTGIQPINVSDDWDDFVGDLSGIEPNISPIDTITDGNIIGFQLDSDILEPNDKYSNIFKKELSMLSEVLKEVKNHGKLVSKRLTEMSKPARGSGSRSVGVTKGYTDLVDAYNGINTTKLQIIKEMAALRAKQVDWRVKEQKEAGPDTQNVESIADNFYKSIIGGGTKNFVQTGMQQYAVRDDFNYDSIFDENDQSVTIRQDHEKEMSELDSLETGVGFNITQPLQGDIREGNEDVIGDEFGYIGREKNPVDICVYEYGNGNYQFVALDSDGEVVEGVELPSDADPEIIETLHLRPGSDYVYDRYNRKYRVIQMGNVDISDVDQMEYPFD